MNESKTVGSVLATGAAGVQTVGMAGGWEIGRAYRLRDIEASGAGVVLGFLHRPGDIDEGCIVGVVVDPDTGTAQAATWTAEGRFLVGRESGLDLTAEPLRAGP